MSSFGFPRIEDLVKTKLLKIGIIVAEITSDRLETRLSPMTNCTRTRQTPTFLFLLSDFRIRVPPGSSTELSSKGFQFVTALFEKHDQASASLPSRICGVQGGPPCRARR